MNGSPENGRQVQTGIALLFFTTFAIRLLMQLRSPYACGIDGYYYALQAKQLLSSGAFLIPDRSPVLYLLSGLCAAGDPVLMLKIGAALLGALPVIPGFLLGRQISGRSGGGFILALLFSLSVSMAYLSIELLKNLGAISFLLFILHYFLKIESGEKSLKTAIPAAGLALLAVLSHRSTALLTLVLTGALLYRLLPLSRKKKILFTTGAAVFGLLLIIAIRGIHPADPGRFTGQFSIIPELPVFSKISRFLFPPALLVEITLAALIPWAVIFFRKKITNPLIRTLWLTLFLLYLPFWKADGAGMGFRLALVGAPLGLIVLFSVFQKIKWDKKHSSVLTAILIAAAIFLPQSAYRPETDPPYSRYKKLLPHIRLPKGSVLICHRGLNLYCTYKTPYEGLSYIPDFPVPRKKLWRLAAYVDFTDIKKTTGLKAGSSLIRKLPYPYTLIREDIWRRFRQQLPTDRRKLLQNSYNPWKRKPWFLRRQQGR